AYSQESFDPGSIQEIIDVVDEVAAEDGIIPPPAGDGTLPPVAPLPLGNAPEGSPAEGMITPQMTPVDLTRDVKPDTLPSLFFTFWEHNAIKDARRARGLARPPTEAELAMLSEGETLERIKPPPEEREIKLGGIAYTRGGDWTIWLNNKRITPKALPKEIVELRVYKDYIEVKWLDDYTQQIFPIRLRPHQRFNMDSRIFLPG
ncbi:MAG TPA: hypothetical protein PLO23_10025, partial [Alphaproteobacteria bacterium]|nr:hypothetical protein [Alphaproteobacteria bacterium]